MNKVLYDKESEDFVREVLNLEGEKSDELFGYVKENGQVKELKTFFELLNYVL